MNARTLAAWTLTLAGAPAALHAQSKAGSEFRVNTYTTNYQDGPTVSADGNARFVVVWSSYGQDGDNEGVFAQRFATK